MRLTIMPVRRLCPGKEVSAASDDFRLTGEKGVVETSAAVVAIEAEQAGLVMQVG